MSACEPAAARLGADQGSPRLSLPIPYGWYFVSYQDELPQGTARAVRYFARDLVLFRTADGVPGLLDAYCPHLGAHLGHGGVVDGESIRCPFHGWAFTPDGFCSEIPYARVMPPIARHRAVIGAYPVCEANGVVWAWYHPGGATPSFDVERYAEFDRPDWVNPVRRMWRFASHPQEVSENGVDVAHLKHVHGLAAVPEGKTVYTGPVRYSVTTGQRVAEFPDGSLVSIECSAESIQNGAGQKIIRLKDMATLSMMALVTPIEVDEVEMRYSFVHAPIAAGSLQDRSIQAIIAGTCNGQTGIEGDIPIWSRKIYRSEPLLCDGDGPILRYRRYFRQFYADDPDAAEGSASRRHSSVTANAIKSPVMTAEDYA